MSKAQNSFTSGEKENIKALYLAVHRGVGHRKLTKAELEQIFNDKSVKNNLKNLANHKIEKITNFIILTMLKEIKLELYDLLDDDQKTNLTDGALSEMVWMMFVSKYGMSPVKIKEFLTKQFTRVIKAN